jgi:hypothetical protein
MNMAGRHLAAAVSFSAGAAAAAGPAVRDSLRVYRHRACESCARGVPGQRGGVTKGGLT